MPSGDALLPPDRRVLLLRPFHLVGRPLHHAKRHGQPGRSLRPQRGVRGLPVQRPVGDGVQDGGHPGPDLPRRAHAALMPGSRRQRGRGLGLVAGPVPGQQGVEHPAQRRGVRRHGVVRGRVAAQRRVEAETGDLEAAGGIPAQRARGQAQVRPTGLMGDGERVGRIGDHGGGQGRVRQPGEHQVFQGRAGCPFGHDVGATGVEISVVDGRQPRVGHLGGGLHRLDHGARDGPGGQQVDRDGPAEQLVAGLPQRKAARLP